MSRITKIARKKNGAFQTPIPIGTASQYVTVDDNKTVTLKQILGDYTKIPEGKISEALKTLDQKQVVINNASATENGLMSSTDFKKINPQILSSATDDLNAVKTPGWYRILCSSNGILQVQNVPSQIQNGEDSCWLEVQQIDDSTYFQKLRTYSGLYFERQYSLSTLWTAWKRKDAIMKGAYPAVKGNEGLVPAPEAGDNNKFLRGDGTWSIPVDTWIANTEASDGYVTNPNGASSKVWKTNENGVPGWRDEKDTTYSNMVNATATTDGRAGLVPAPAKGKQNYLLSASGWTTPNTTNGGQVKGLLLTNGQYDALKSMTHSWSKYGVQLAPPTKFSNGEAPGHGGFIDFHYNGSTADYTSRIIERPSGTLQIPKNLKVVGSTTLSSLTVSGNTVVNGTLKAQREDSGENGHIVVVSSAAATGLTYMLNSYTGSGLQVTARWGQNSGSSTKTLALSTSDIRLKQNIKESTVSGLELINKIPLYEFDWKQQGYHQKIGFIADYLEKIDSNLSIGDKTQDEEGRPVYKSVNSFYLQGFEVKAIQELSQQNEELKKEINLLKEEIKELKKK